MIPCSNPLWGLRSSMRMTPDYGPDHEGSRVSQMTTTRHDSPALSPSASRRTPPTVRGHRLFGVMPELTSDPLGLYGRAWKEHGDLVRLRALPGVHFFLLAHPGHVEHVLAKNHKNYRKPDSFNKSAGLLAGM